MTARTAPAPYAVWRALAATVLVMVGAVSAHSWAGGGLPGLPGLLILAGVLFAGGLLSLKGELRPVVVAPVVAVAQTGLHVSFGLLGTAPGGHAGHPAHVPPVGDGSDPVWWSWQMVLAHLVSTMLTVAVWALCQRAASVLVSVVGEHVHVAFRLPRARPTEASGPVAASDWLVGAPRRGPPAAARCA